MPELPEVETVRRGLAPAMEGARFKKVETRRKDLRWPLPKDFVKRLEGQKVEGVGRRAKYLTVDVSSGDVLLMHLGMSGSFRVVKDAARHCSPARYHYDKGKLEKHDHVVFHMSNGSVVTFNDPRRFGSMKIVPRAKIDDEPLLRWIGPEPLGNAFDAAMLADGLRGQEDVAESGAARSDAWSPASATSMPARRCSARGCRRSGWPRRSPTATASRTSGRAALVDAIKAVLNDAIKAGGSSLRDHRRADGSLGDFQHNFLVYDREGKPCPDTLQGQGETVHAERALDLLVPGAARSDRRPPLVPGVRNLLSYPQAEKATDKGEAICAGFFLCDFRGGVGIAGSRTISRQADPFHRAAGGGQQHRSLFAPDRRGDEQDARPADRHREQARRCVHRRPRRHREVAAGWLHDRHGPDRRPGDRAAHGCEAALRHREATSRRSRRCRAAYLILAVSPKSPLNSVEEVIDYAKQNPGKLSNASSATGSPGHVGGELFKYDGRREDHPCALPRRLRSR